MRIGKPRAFPRKPVEVRRGNFRVRVVATEVAIAEIIGEDDDDIRRLRRPAVAEHCDE